MSRSAREDAINQWEIDRPKRDAARAKRELRYPVSYDELADYNDTVKKVMSDLKSSVAPCMPLVMSKPAVDDDTNDLRPQDLIKGESELGLKSPISKAFAATTKTKNKKLRRVISGLNQIYDLMVEEHREKVCRTRNFRFRFHWFGMCCFSKCLRAQATHSKRVACNSPGCRCCSSRIRSTQHTELG